MHISVLNDLFVTREILQGAFEKAFENSGLTFEYNYLEDTWPATPVMQTDEVREFVGDEDLTAEAVKDAEIILTHTAPITRKVLASAPKLKVLGVARGGPVNINWDACTERGIPVLYAPGRNSGAVAEFTVGAMLAASRNIVRSHMSLMNEKRWRGDLYVNSAVGTELSAATVGLIGLGAIGSKVAKLVMAFGASVLVYDPYVKPEAILELGAKVASMDEVLEQSDFISLHARYTPETKDMIGEREIGLMKKTAYLVNTARGELIDHTALYPALREGRIAGAALDIFENEPPAEDSPLFTLENVVATSHLAGASIQAAQIGAQVLSQGIYDFVVAKKVPKYCVNPDYVKFLKS